MLEIRVLPSPSGTAHVVKVVGRLDRFSAATFVRGLGALPGSIRLDCSDLDGVDTAGFAALVTLHETCRGRGDRCVITGLLTPPRAEWSAWPGIEHLELGERQEWEGAAGLSA
jgi:anti-anti-sigma regulatory factor